MGRRKRRSLLVELLEDRNVPSYLTESYGDWTLTPSPPNGAWSQPVSGSHLLFAGFGPNDDWSRLTIESPQEVDLNALLSTQEWAAFHARFPTYDLNPSLSFSHPNGFLSDDSLLVKHYPATINPPEYANAVGAQLGVQYDPHEGDPANVSWIQTIQTTGRPNYFPIDVDTPGNSPYYDDRGFASDYGFYDAPYAAEMDPDYWIRFRATTLLVETVS